jgi:DNA polymerase-3 subunit gamma/tau
MAYEPLHHKYRPQTFKDLVGQEAIADTLIEAIKLAKIAPAYLFTGPRGTGKTSSARILAKSLNCLTYSKPTPTPCGNCEVCRAIAYGNALDVIEIDAASNTGVDNIRELIERSRFAPVQSRYKVYAIDECHMLSTAAFNALLKTLEEPPPQVVFILATTDPQRVLSTIISRCQRFDYRRIRLEAMISHLQYIAQQENIDITIEALTLTSQIANGGLRDAESLLDQLSLFPETITVDKIWDLVGAVPERDLLALLKAIREQDIEDIVTQCRNLLDRGREPLVLLQNLAGFYLNLLIAKTSPHRQDLVAVTETCWQHLCDEAQYWQFETILRGQQQLKEGEVQIKNTTQPRLWLEVTLIGLLDTVAVQRMEQQPNTIEQSSFSVQDKAIANATQNNFTAQRHSLNGNSVAKTNTPDVGSKTPVKEHQAVANTSNTSATETTTPQQPTDAEQTPTQSTPTTISTNPQPTIDKEVSAPDRASIWQQVIDCIHPPMTQALLRQQCHLIDLSDTSAIVGISSMPLKKMNQGKVPNIEAAFAKVCQRPIKVTLEVASQQNRSTQTTSSQTTTIERSHTTSTVTNPKHPTTLQEPPPLEVRSPLKSLETTTIQQQQIKTNSVVVIQETTAESTLNNDLASNSAEIATDDDFAKAVELVAQKFDGEVIEFPDSLGQTEHRETEKFVKQQKVVITREAIAPYDDEDIPF